MDEDEKDWYRRLFKERPRLRRPLYRFLVNWADGKYDPPDEPQGTDTKFGQQPGGGKTREKVGEPWDGPPPPPEVEDKLNPWLEWKLDVIMWLLNKIRLLLRRLLLMLIPPIIVVVIIPIIALCGWLLLVVPRAPILPVTRTPTATATAPGSPLTLTVTPTPTFTPTPTPTLPAVFRVTIVVVLDPAGHNAYISMPVTLDLTVVIEGNTITITGPAPWVTVKGAVNPDGSFKATGAGTVAGYPNINVEFVAAITAKDGLVGDYTMGVGGGLPTSRSITYHLQGQGVPAAAAAPAASADTAIPGLQDFLAQLTTALRTNDAAFLFSHLHPAAVQVYGAQTCQAHLQQRSPDPTYNIDFISATGPASWVYAPPGQAQVTVDNVYAVNARVTEQGQTSTVAMHIAGVNGQWAWFTACR